MGHDCCAWEDISQAAQCCIGAKVLMAKASSVQVALYYTGAYYTFLAWRPWCCRLVWCRIRLHAHPGCHPQEAGCLAMQPEVLKSAL